MCAFRGFEEFSTILECFEEFQGFAKIFEALLSMVGFKHDSGAVGQACTRLKTAQTQCSHGWFQKKKSHAVKQACTSGGGGGAQPCMQTYCSHCEMGGVQQDSYYARPGGCQARAGGGGGKGAQSPPYLQTQCSHGWFQKHSFAVKQACTSGGVGGRSTPSPCANTPLAW